MISVSTGVGQWENPWGKDAFRHDRTRVTLESRACVPPHNEPAVDLAQGSGLIFEWILDKSRAYANWNEVLNEMGECPEFLEPILKIPLSDMESPNENSVEVCIYLYTCCDFRQPLQRL